MIFFTEDEIDRLIAEDVPYGDLTTWSMGINSADGLFEVYTRDRAVVCGTEEALRICTKLGLQPEYGAASGSSVQPGEVVLRAAGRADGLHMAWKVVQNVLESCSGIATKTRSVVDAVHSANPSVSVAGSRKSFPGTKKLAVKALLCGGASPHRLGLSETLLIFAEHLEFAGGIKHFHGLIPGIRQRAPEKRLLIEVSSREEALALADSGVDALQLDKFPLPALRELVLELRQANPGLMLLAAGGIDEHNAREYALTGVDVLVTSSLYVARPVDMSVRMTNVAVKKEKEH